MKKIEITKPNSSTIDWQKPQYVVSKIFPNVIVAVQGEIGPSTFSGFAFPCPEFRSGKYTDSWVKRDFELFNGSAILNIENE